MKRFCGPSRNDQRGIIKETLHEGEIKKKVIGIEKGGGPMRGAWGLIQRSQGHQKGGKNETFDHRRVRTSKTMAKG